MIEISVKEIAKYSKKHFQYLTSQFKEDEEIINLFLKKAPQLLFTYIDKKFWNHKRFMDAVQNRPIIILEYLKMRLHLT